MLNFKWKDLLFLTSIVIASALPYIFGLGYYSDDYSYLATMSQTKPQTFYAIFQNLTNLPDFAHRPVQALYISYIYNYTHLHPFWGHFINHFVFILGVIFFYLSLTKIFVSRFICLSLPLIFLSLPHYSSDRFWFATYQINFSMTIFFICFLCSAKAAEKSAQHRWLWFLLATVAIPVSAMSYAIFLPLFLIIPVLICLSQLYFKDLQRRHELFSQNFSLINLLIFIIFLILIIISFVIKINILDGHRIWQGGTGEWFYAVFWLLQGAIKSAFWENGIKLPLNTAVLIQQYWRLEAVLVAGALFIAIFAYILNIVRFRSVSESWDVIGALAGFGLMIFFGGYAIFANNFMVGFSPTGIANRVAIAASVGVAAIALSVLLAIERLIPRYLSTIFVALSLSIGCTTGFLVNGTLGVLWSEAALMQRSLLSQLEADLPTLPAGTTVMLDGFCPFVGPAPIFESSWDLRGALQILYADETLKADVIKANTEFLEYNIKTTLYGTITSEYPYQNLLIYNATERNFWWINNFNDADYYLANHYSSAPAGCIFKDGGGIDVYNGY